MNDRGSISCADVDELAGLFVLDALDAADAAAVSEHLAECPQAHATFARLGAASSEMAMIVEPVDMPEPMRDRVLAAIARTPQVPDAPTHLSSGRAHPTGSMAGEPPVTSAAASRSGWRQWIARGRSGGGRERLGWMGMAAAVVAVLLVVTGIVATLERRSTESDRLGLLRDAVTAAADPGNTVAVLAGSTAAPAARGYAILPETGDGYIVVDGLPPVESGTAYQAWLIGEGDPVSAGVLDLSADGLGTLTGVARLPDTAVVALSIEELPGAQAPTSAPVVVGEIRTVEG
jgi:hypothetical protein